MNTNIEKCNNDLLDKQKEQLKHEIVYGKNKDHFAVFDIEAGCRKTRTAEEALIELVNQGKKAIFVRQFDADCIESEAIINTLSKSNIAFAYNNETVSTKTRATFNKTINNIPIIIITHQKYKVLMCDIRQRNIFIAGRETLVVDEFLSTIETISLSENDIATYKMLFSNDPVICTAFLKAIHQPEDFLKTWNIKDSSRKFTSFEDKSPNKDFNRLVQLIKANITNEILNDWKTKIINVYRKNETDNIFINFQLLDSLTTVRVLSEKVFSLKELFRGMCLYSDKKLYTTDKRHQYWFLDNNIMLDASGELQSAYELNKENFQLQHCHKVLDHSNWTIINIPITTTTSGKDKIINFYDVVNHELSKYGNDVLVVGKKNEMNLINVPEDNKGYFGNVTGSNKWYDKKHVAIIQTHNLNDVDYILKYLHYSREYIDRNPSLTLASRCNGYLPGRKIYGFTNSQLEKIRISWIASEIYQAIKRVNRNMKYNSNVLIFLNNSDIIELLCKQMKNCKLKIIDNVEEIFEFEKCRKQEYIEELKKDSYASKFINFLAEVENGLHKDMIDTEGRISKKTARELLGIKTSGNFSNKVLNKSEVITYCDVRNIKINGQYIKFLKTG